MSRDPGGASRRSEGSGLALLTVAGCVAIVLAFHWRFRGEIAGAEARAQTVDGAVRRVSEWSGRAEGARPPPPVAESWVAPAPAVPETPGRWVGGAGGAPALGEGVVFPPTALRAEAGERGVTLRWLPHDRNPPEGVSYEVYRWREGEGVRSLGGESPALTVADTEVCPLTRFSYCVVSVVRDRLEGVELRRSRRSDPVQVFVGERYAFDLLGVENGRARIRATVPATGRSFETSESPGEVVGSSAGEPTGFVLEAIETLPREEEVEVRLPVFRADGSREVEDGRPVFRSRAELRAVPYPSVRLRDACGTARTATAGTPSPAR